MDDLLERVLNFAVTLQQIPAPTFNEGRRAAFVLQQFRREGLSDVFMDPTGNAYGRMPGMGIRLPVVVSAHLDTVFPEDVDLKITRDIDRIAGPGIGDNSMGVAGLFGLLWALRQSKIQLPGDLWLVANVGEEGLGDLCGIRAVVDRFGERVSAYIILEGMALGQVYHRGLGVQRYRITVQTAGGHSWVDYGRPSAVHELALLVNRLTAIPLPVEPRTTLNVGVVGGGTTINTIAAKAYLELDLRSEESRALDNLVGQVEELVAASNRPNVMVRAEIIGRRPAAEISPDHPLVRLAIHCLQSQGIQACLNIGSTDANIALSRGLPAVCIGLTTGFGAHTQGEYVRIQPLSQGVDQIVTLVQKIFD
jgi:tripeptide aminopeptidase